MGRVNLMIHELALGAIVVTCAAAFSGCEYNVPITTKPTQKVDVRLLGNWTSKDGRTKLKIVKLDDSNYIVSDCPNGDAYRVYHSDVARTAFVTVQLLDKPGPRYAYWHWRLSEDGTLHLRLVSDKIVPDETKESAGVRKLLEGNLQNPNLLGEDDQFTRDS